MTAPAKALRDFFLTDVGVSAITSEIYHGRALEDCDYPCIVIELSTTEHVRDLSGGSGYFQWQAQIMCLDTSAQGAWELVDAVREAIDNIDDNLILGYYAEVAVLSISQQLTDRASGSQFPIYGYSALLEGFSKETLTPT